MNTDRSCLIAELGRWPILSKLPPEDLAILADLGTSRVLEGGARLIDEGARVASLWILLGGRASVEVGSGAARTLVNTLEPGALLGEVSYLTGRPASASVTALSDCRLVEFSQVSLRRACEAHPAFGLRVERLLTALLTERLSRAVGGGSQVALPAVDASLLKSLRTLGLQAIEDEAITRYGRFGQRNPFLWRWILRAQELTTLPCLPAERQLEARATKLLAAVVVVIVDDVADLGRSPRELDEALALLGECPAPPPPSALLPSLREELVWVWSALHERARRLPRYEVFADLLAFDLKMVFIANRHARLSRDVQAVLNPTETLDYGPHGIAVLVFATLDLMASPPLAVEDLSALRELVHAGQTLCELANMIATWQREIPDRDFGSRIFTLGLARGTFSRTELSELPREAIVARIQEADLEGLLMAEWRSHKARAEAAAARIRGFDPRPLLAGYDAVFGMTLAARGSV